MLQATTTSSDRRAMEELIEILKCNGHAAADPSSLLRDELLEAVRALHKRSSR
jgi:hypothetical protein